MRMWSGPITLAAILGLVAASPPALAVELTGTIKGTVIDTDDIGVPNAAVSLESEDLMGEYTSLTDAEGRLILADALAYAKKFAPELTLTLATLTGAQIVALGHDMAALYATDDEYAKLVEEASKETGELVWRMPLYEKYKSRYLKSRVADLNNIASVRTAGSIIGALFLSEFAPKPWVYLDIAGPALAHEGNVDWASPYPTGWGTRLTLRTLEKLSQK